MPEHVRDEGPGKLAGELGTIAEGLREPSQRDGEHEDADQADPEVGKGRGHDEDGGEHAVQDAAPAPGAKDPDQRPQDEGNQGCHANQSECPGQRQHDHVADALRIEAERNAEITAQHVPHIREVLLDRALVVADAQRRLEAFDGGRLDAAVEAREQGHLGAARKQPGQDEVERECGPERHHEKLEAPDQVPHSRYILTTCAPSAASAPSRGCSRAPGRRRDRPWLASRRSPSCCTGTRPRSPSPG